MSNGRPLYFSRRSGEQPDGPRYVWHSEVHRLYGERCYFFLLSAPDPSPEFTLTQQITELFTKEDIHSYSLYDLFGSFDAVIRVWASESAAIRISAALERIATEDLLMLEVDSIDYTFSVSQRPTQEDILKFRSQIIEVTEREIKDEWPPATDRLPDEIIELQDAQLILKVPEAQFAVEEGHSIGIKFYVFLQRRGTLRTFNQIEHYTRELRRAIASSTAQACTIYGLQNYQGYLLKGVAESFESTRKTLRPIYEFCAENDFRPLTFPIPNLTEAREADLVDVAVREENWTEGLTVDRMEAMAPGARAYLGALSKANREAFIDFHSNHDAISSDSRIWADLSDLLVGIATQSANTISRSLGFVLEIEDRIRYATWFSLRNELTSEEWQARLVSELVPGHPEWPELNSVNTEDETPFEDWTFRDLSVLWGIAASKYAALNDLYRELLGSEFRTEFTELRRLRNELAHGKYRATVDEDGQEIRRYLYAAGVHMALDKYIQTQENVNK